MADETNDREIVVTRVFDAPCELVFEAFTDPRHVSEWYGPTGFTITTHEMDVKSGGIWRFVMHAPDGTDYPNLIVYREVVKPERLVFLHGDDEEDGQQFHVTVTFDAIDGKTKLTLRQLYATPEERDRAVDEIGAIEGANQTLDRLAEYLKGL